MFGIIVNQSNGFEGASFELDSLRLKIALLETESVNSSPRFRQRNIFVLARPPLAASREIPLLTYVRAIKSKIFRSTHNNGFQNL
jgi:hypothetical protein